MSAALLTGLLLLCLGTSAGEAEAPAAPQNLTMLTLNTNYTLRWDWDQSGPASRNVTFTTECVPKYKLKSLTRVPKWSAACVDKPFRSCDVTDKNLHYLGIYVLRVRANLNGRHSPWVQKEFCPDKDAAVGPPSRVDLSLSGSVLDVIILDPLTSKNVSMQEVIDKLYYRILYWENSADEVSELNVNTNLVTLPNLKPWTLYCVSVQSRADFYNKSSSFTSPRCMQTEGTIPWWQILLYFLGSLFICFTLVLFALFGFYRTYKTFKATFCPSNQLPSHFKEYLCDSPGSDIPRLLTPDSESELLCDKVIVCAEPVLEIHNPPPVALPSPPSGLEPDSSGRHSRQDSSGSGDSGVYSTGGSGSSSSGSSSSGSSSGCSSSGCSAQSSDGALLKVQVKMQDMAPGLKSRPLITDEGIVDVCV